MKRLGIIALIFTSLILAEGSDDQFDPSRGVQMTRLRNYVDSHGEPLDAEYDSFFDGQQVEVVPINTNSYIVSENNTQKVSSKQRVKAKRNIGFSFSQMAKSVRKNEVPTQSFNFGGLINERRTQ